MLTMRVQRLVRLLTTNRSTSSRSIYNRVQAAATLSALSFACQLSLRGRRSGRVHKRRVFPQLRTTASRSSTAAPVMGFGCRPFTSSTTGAGPASESLQGRKPRGIGHRRAAVSMWIWRARRACEKRGDRARSADRDGRRTLPGCRPAQGRCRAMMRGGRQAVRRPVSGKRHCGRRTTSGDSNRHSPCAGR